MFWSIVAAAHADGGAHDNGCELPGLICWSASQWAIPCRLLRLQETRVTVWRIGSQIQR